VLHAVVGCEIEERRPRDHVGGKTIDVGRRRVGQEHDAGLRAQADDMARAVVLLVATRALVLL
jgi:hypothetical protein